MRQVLQKVKAVAAYGLLALVLPFAVAPAQTTSAPGGTVISVSATATYIPDGYVQPETVNSPTLQLIIDTVHSLGLSQDLTVQRAANVWVSLPHTLKNTGNVASSYTLNVVNNGAGCGADTLDLTSLSIVRDINNNGVADPSEPVIALGAAGGVHLNAGDTASLLIAGLTPSSPTGSACLSLTASDDATSGATLASGRNVDMVTIAPVASVVVTAKATYPGVIIAGVTDIGYTVSASNVGSQDAAPSATAGAGGTQVLVNGSPMSLFLLTSNIAPGSQYEAGSLASSTVGAIRLFRLPGDPPYSYRTGGDDASAIEVAIGLPTSLPRNGTLGMSYQAKVVSTVTGSLVNHGEASFNNGAGPVLEKSNTLVIATPAVRIGLSSTATSPIPGILADGSFDRILKVHFTLRVKNYGINTLYDPAVSNVLEGLGAQQFGTYTAAATPGTGQYTIVPGTMALSNWVGGTTSAVANTTFSGQAGNAQMLQSGGVLPSGGEFTISFDAFINATGRTGTAYMNAVSLSAPYAGGPQSIVDASVNGADPDPDGDGDPTNNTSGTPVPMDSPAFSLVKTVGLPRKQSNGDYLLDYVIRIVNNGGAVAPNVRVVDNLDCTFMMDSASGPIASWSMESAPAAANHKLRISPAFTGHAACDRAGIASTNAVTSIPQSSAVTLTDGRNPLGAGQTEVISFTVRVKPRNPVATNPVELVNKAWAAAYDADSATAVTVAATATSVAATLVDPQGVVYDSTSRQPVANATVIIKRESCLASAPGPIVAAELFNGTTPGLFTYNPDGTVSMTTSSTGEYQFFFRTPPVNDLCDYSISVVPPSGSTLRYPSSLLPAQSGTFTTCGAVVPGAGVPGTSDPTTYYNQSISVSGLSVNDNISAVAIRTDGASAGNTSEFSANVPISATVKLRSTTVGAVGTLTFNVTNLDANMLTAGTQTSAAVTTVTAGTAVAYDSDTTAAGVQDMPAVALGTVTTVSQGVPAAWSLTSGSCTDGTTTWTAPSTPLAGGVGVNGTVTIPAAAVVAGAAITCDFTSTQAPPKIRIAETTNGGVATFGFTLTGASGTTDSITTVTSGTTVTSATVFTGTVGTALSITQGSAPAGWSSTPAAITCLDTAFASASVGTVSGSPRHVTEFHQGQAVIAEDQYAAGK